MNTVFLEELTSPQIRAVIASGFRTVIIPAGAVEQHGRHLPIGTDAFDGPVIGEAIARRLGQTLVAPTIRPGCSDHHMPFAGTITISHQLMVDLVGAYCRSLCQHGFENIVLIASHGGNITALNDAAAELDAALPCRVVHANILRDPGPRAAGAAVLAKYGISEEEGGRHSGFTETSMMLDSPHAQWIDMSAAQRGFVGDADTKLREITHDGHWDMRDVSPIGVMGDPTRATAEAGRALWDVLIPAYTDVVRAAISGN